MTRTTRLRILLLCLMITAVAALGAGLAAASSAGSQAQASGSATGGVDPRSGGLEIGLGEWALTLEARAIRPGRVTFVIRNRGKFRHGFELEVRRDHDRPARGGGDDDAKSVRLEPGEQTTLTVNLAPGVYELECFVSHHDELGMRGLLEVREDAPLVAPPAAAKPSTVAIASFAFKPATLRTTVGSVVTWRNSDPAPHTATGKQFSSPQLGKGATFRHRFARAGTYAYVCALHPGMTGKVVVAARSSR
jgi:plastocyanin